MDKKRAVRIYKALGDQKRLEILDILKNGEKCACDILELLTISQPTLSHHMKLLSDAGIIKARKDGKWVHYSLSDVGIKDLIENLNSYI